MFGAGNRTPSLPRRPSPGRGLRLARDAQSWAGCAAARSRLDTSHWAAGQPQHPNGGHWWTGSCLQRWQLRGLCETRSLSGGGSVSCQRVRKTLGEALTYFLHPQPAPYEACPGLHTHAHSLEDATLLQTVLAAIPHGRVVHSLDGPIDGLEDILVHTLGDADGGGSHTEGLSEEC